MKNEISEQFYDAIISAGSTVIDCELCGKTHFTTTSHSYEEGELEKLLEKAKAEPHIYIAHNDDDTIHWGYLNGKQVVYNCCDECNKDMYKYEKFIWNHRFLISKYLNLMVEEQIKNTNLEKENADNISKTLKREKI